MLRLDHVQLAIPKGAEDLCRPFYVGLLGLKEVPKPAALAGRGIEVKALSTMADTLRRLGLSHKKIAQGR